MTPGTTGFGRTLHDRAEFDAILAANGYVEVPPESAPLCDDCLEDGLSVAATVRYLGHFACSKHAVEFVGALPAIAAARDWPHLRSTGELRLAS